MEWVESSDVPLSCGVMIFTISKSSISERNLHVVKTYQLINFRSCAKSCKYEMKFESVKFITLEWLIRSSQLPKKNHHRRSLWGNEKTHPRRTLRCTHGKWSLWRRISPNAKLKMKRWLLWWMHPVTGVPDTVPHPSFFQVHSWLYKSRARMYFKFQLLHLNPLKSMIILQQKIKKE